MPLVVLCLLVPIAVAACGAADDDSAALDAGSVSADGGTTPSELKGWISVIELNDTCNQMYLRTNWLGGVRAYFAEKMSFQRSLAHHADFMTKVATVGNCTVYNHPNYDGFQGDSNIHCANPVGWQPTEGESGEAAEWCPLDQECEHSANSMIEAECRKLPPHADLGNIAISGLSNDLTLVPDELDRYFPPSIPEQNANLFEAGATITAKVSGGTEQPFTLEAKGVAPLELKNNGSLALTNAGGTVSWVPGTAEARVEVAIPIGLHDPNPLVQLIVCDVPDSAGSLEIPSEIAAKVAPGTFSQKCSRVTRYNKSVTEHLGGEIELFVGSARNLAVIYDLAQADDGI